MADRKPPVLDAAILCAEVVRDANDAVFALNELQHTVVVDPNEEGKLEAPELVLFVQMNDRDAQGTYEFGVEVRSDTGVIIPSETVSGVHVTFVSHYYPLYPFEHEFVFRRLVFPGPGVYHFHVMCGSASMSAREACAKAPKLYVVRAEPGDEL